MANEHRELATRWLKKTEEALSFEIDRLKVKESGDLRRSLSSKVTEMSDGIIKAELSFKTRGRFVDMGAGRRAKLEGLTKRKPKKWYSPAFYGRLNSLQGAIGIVVMEDSLNTIKKIENEKS